MAGKKKRRKQRGKRRKTGHRTFRFLLVIFILSVGLGYADFYGFVDVRETAETAVTFVTASVEEWTEGENSDAIDPDEIPEYDDSPYVEINNNEPDFTEEELEADPYESYSELDELGRCGTAIAMISEEMMPDEEREDISAVYPSGWEQEAYDFIDGGYIYNRCHLIGYQLTGENANEENLITGTRYMNVEGMLPFENLVADYIEETGGYVLYEVTPVFEDDNLVASGVYMQAISVDDDGESISFSVFCYNVQPGVEIDYETGENWESEE